jgi:hypothetical protein
VQDVTVTAVDEAFVRKQAEAIARQLPREAEDKEVISVTLKVIAFGRYEGLTISLRYRLFGQTFRVQALLVPAGSELWTFQFDAADAQFDRAYEPFRASLYSIQGLAVAKPLRSEQ